MALREQIEAAYREASVKAQTSRYAREQWLQILKWSGYFAVIAVVIGLFVMGLRSCAHRTPTVPPVVNEGIPGGTRTSDPERKAFVDFLNTHTLRTRDPSHPAYVLNVGDDGKTVSGYQTHPSGRVISMATPADDELKEIRRRAGSRMGPTAIAYRYWDPKDPVAWHGLGLIDRKSNGSVWLIHFDSSGQEYPHDIEDIGLRARVAQDTGSESLADYLNRSRFESESCSLWEIDIVGSRVVGGRAVSRAGVEGRILDGTVDASGVTFGWQAGLASGRDIVRRQADGQVVDRCLTAPGQNHLKRIGDKLAKGAVPPANTIVNGTADTRECATLDLGTGVAMRLVKIKPGTFTMGSPANETGRFDDEGPHPVTLTKSFYMGVTAVTQGQYEAVMGGNPSAFKGSKNPVEQVSWDEAVEFCRKVSARTGKTVQLPTEAQWEYACRAGGAGPYAGTGKLDEMGWFDGNGANSTHPVATKQPNAWGLYDMHGNVWEFCSDWYGTYPTGAVADPSGPATGDRRVLRGGSWHHEPRSCRAAARHWSGPGLRFQYVGFRVCMVEAAADPPVAPYTARSEGQVIGVAGGRIQIDLGARDQIKVGSILTIEQSALPIVVRGVKKGCEVVDARVLEVTKETCWVAATGANAVAHDKVVVKSIAGE